MSEQFLRRCSLVVAEDDGTIRAGAGIELAELRVRFATRQADIQTPNTLYARVFNLSRNTAEFIGIGSFLSSEINLRRCVLKAGFQGEGGNYDVIFDGQIKQTRYGRIDATTTYYDILASDGDAAFNRAVVSATIAAGATPQDQAGAVLRAMEEQGVRAGYMAPLGAATLPRGKVMYGKADDHLRDLSSNQGVAAAVINGQLQMVPLNSYLPGEAIEINAQTGMIGVPEQTQEGIRVSAMLNPQFRVAGRVRLNNRSIQRAQFPSGYDYTGFFFLPAISTEADGDYRIMVAEHRGDTRGQDWQTDLICLALNSPVPPALVPRLLTQP